MIIKTPKRKQFVTVSNKLAQDAQLSFEARGVLVYLLSHPENWRILAADIERSGSIGAERRRRVMSELEDAGYLTSYRVQDEKGLWGWESILHETPVDTEKRTSQLGRGARVRSVKNRSSAEPDFGVAELRVTSLVNKKHDGIKTKHRKNGESVCTTADADTHSPSLLHSAKKKTGKKSVPAKEEEIRLAPDKMAVYDILRTYFPGLGTHYKYRELARFVQENTFSPYGAALMCAWLESQGRSFSFMTLTLLEQIRAEFNAGDEGGKEMARYYSHRPHTEKMKKLMAIHDEWNEKYGSQKQ